MTKATYTEIVVVLDRSGSMQTIAKDMCGGFDAFVREQKLVPGECKLSLYQFDTEHETVYEGRELRDVPPLSLVPRGGTALYDAVGRAVRSTGERLSALPEHERPGKVVCLVITDGEENSSKQYAAWQIREMIEHQEKKYGWGFAYLGVSSLTTQHAAAIGINSSATFDSTPMGTQRLYGAIGQSVSNYRSGTHGMSWSSNFVPPASVTGGPPVPLPPPPPVDDEGPAKA